MLETEHTNGDGIKQISGQCPADSFHDAIQIQQISRAPGRARQRREPGRGLLRDAEQGGGEAEPEAEAGGSARVARLGKRIRGLVS